MKNENDVLRKKIQSGPSRGFFFPNGTDWSIIGCFEIPKLFAVPCFPAIKKKKIVKIQRFALKAAIGDTRYAWNQDGCPYR